MAGSWDITLKRWVGEVPQDFVSWLLHGAIFEREAPSHLKNRTVDADLLYRVLVNDRPYMFHAEFQSTSHPQMAERMWEYNLLSTLEYQLPVHSFLIYLKKGKESDDAFASSPFIQKSAFGEDIHRFHYTVIKMWEVPTHLLLNAGYKGLLPLIPLTREGTQHEAIEQAITLLTPPGEKPEVDLLASLYALGSLAYTKDVSKNWLQRRFSVMDSLKDSWVYQEWKQEGVEQGLQQGVEQGLQQGVEQGLQQGRRQDIMALVQKRFPALTMLAQERVTLLKTPELLQNLLLQIAVAQNEQDVRRYLLEAGEEQKH